MTTVMPVSWVVDASDVMMLAGHTTGSPAKVLVAVLLPQVSPTEAQKVEQWEVSPPAGLTVRDEHGGVAGSPSMRLQTQHSLAPVPPLSLVLLLLHPTACAKQAPKNIIPAPSHSFLDIRVSVERGEPQA
jgi:hypothetical protein